MLSRYGVAPEIVCRVDLEPSEMCFVQYLPIKMAKYPDLRIPHNLAWTWPLLKLVMRDASLEDYIYLTIRHMWVSNEYKGNRHGWHTDGFGTDDINFIWYDCMPTEFCVQEFDLSSDHDISMQQMQEQAKEENIITYPNKTLLKMDQRVVHRVSENNESGMRTFIKVSISKDKYNLKGNAHNYLFDYGWDMIDRDIKRNHPSKEKSND